MEIRQALYVCYTIFLTHHANIPSNTWLYPDYGRALNILKLQGAIDLPSRILFELYSHISASGLTQDFFFVSTFQGVK